MKIFLVTIIAYLLTTTMSWALDVKEFNAKVIDVSKSEATLFSHESTFMGLSCKSGPVAKLSNLKTIKIGDKITIGKYQLNAGLIKVTKYNEDFKYGGKTIAKKGDIECVIAADEESLPSDKDCEALWVRVVNCLPLK